MRQNSFAGAAVRGVKAATGVLCGIALAAHAGTFSVAGVDGQWIAGASAGTSIRTGSADPALVGKGNGGLSGSSTDDGELNFGKGDVFSSVVKVSAELQLRRDNLGLVLGGRGWYDYTLENSGVAHGNYTGGYVPDRRLSDADYDTLSKFAGAALQNAYVFGNFRLAPGKPLTIRLGNQIVNWGESVFVPGINQYNVFDITASNRAGARVKEILLPVPQLYASLGLGGGLSAEGFYQFQWDKNIFDGCGTYWSTSNPLNCNGAVIGADTAPDQKRYSGTPNVRLDRAGDLHPKDSGQFGAALRYALDSIDTEFGLYYVQYHTHSPIVSIVKIPSSSAQSIWAGISTQPPTQYLLDYSAQDIKLGGLSLSSLIAGWAVAGELSYRSGVPVQINVTDIFNGDAGLGPQASYHALPLGSLIHGYDRKNKAQAQASATRIVASVLGAESLTVVGEVAYQYWSGIGGPGTGTRYGRSTVFGFAETATIPCAKTGNLNPDYCQDKGFVTRSSGGYRLLGELSYPNVFAGVNLRPRLFWSQDVAGYSGDGAFIAGRQILGAGVRAEYNKRFYGDLSYTHYNPDAKYDLLHDRDYAAVVAGIDF